MQLLDKTKTHKLLNEKVSGWDMDAPWNIVNEAIYRFEEYESAIEYMEDIQNQLKKCILEIKSNKAKVTVIEENRKPVN
tara:strand:+ start:687 stop:923 length:237 start_codon:yes stop_codon:yes gene_type:complete